MNPWISGIAMAAAIQVAFVNGTAAAASFPQKPVRIIVPTAVGGPSDLCIRAVTDAMQAELGQSLVVENVTGATGNIGLERVANAPADGYTIAQASAANTANLAARPKASFDIANELKPIGKVCVAAFTFVVPPKLGVKSVEEFIRYAKANPGKLSYGSIGYGSSQHLVGEMFAAMTGIDITHVPYRGESAVAPDMAAGRIQMMFMAGAKPFIDGGLLVGLATTNRDTWRPMPSLPPIGRTALPGFTYNGWNGLLAPKGTPDAIVRRLNEALNRALAGAKARATIHVLGNEPGPGTPDDLGKQIRDDLAKFKRIIDERRLTFPE
jgi:tripartite-type tricarboxylate transporter receptor subunit TctC